MLIDRTSRAKELTLTLPDSRYYLPPRYVYFHVERKKKESTSFLVKEEKGVDIGYQGNVNPLSYIPFTEL